MTDFRERPEFLRGRAAEQRVAGWLQERGWYVIPSYDYAGDDKDKPPRLQGLLKGHAVPDLDTARDGHRKWVEVKSKGKANVWHKSVPWGRPDVPEHGINHRNYLDYLKVKDITGDDVWIAIYEEDTHQLLIAEIAALGKPRLGNWAGQPIANWPRDRFWLLHTFGQEAAA